MARLAATALLLLSLLALANCRVLEAEPETVVAFSDEKSQADAAVPQETVPDEAIPSVPTVTVAKGILRLPSHRGPCRHGFLHRHLPWARHHGLSHHHSAFPGPGEDRAIPAFLPEVPREDVLKAVVEKDTKKPPHGDGEAQLEAVAEPDPDTRLDTDGEQIPFHGEEEENESVKAWKGEMLRRFRGHGLRFHHRHHHHHEQAMAGEKDESDDQEQQERVEGAGNMHVKMFSRHFHHHHHGDVEREQQDKEEGAGGMHVKLFRRRFHHHHHGDEEQDETARKHYFQHRHHHDSDNEVDVDEVEELAMRLSKAIMRRSLSRGGILHNPHHHHHAEEGGVRKWFKRLLNTNRF